MMPAARDAATVFDVVAPIPLGLIPVMLGPGIK